MCILVATCTTSNILGAVNFVYRLQSAAENNYYECLKYLPINVLIFFLIATVQK